MYPQQQNLLRLLADIALFVPMLYFLYKICIIFYKYHSYAAKGHPRPIIDIIRSMDSNLHKSNIITMSRDIKFRAWDPEFKLMIFDLNSEGYALSDTGGKISVGSFDGNEDYFTLELMQYTGLKDKNGVEIFEGDVVTYNGQSCIISYVECSFCLINQGVEIGFIKNKKLEVIGNIHQNYETII